MAEENERPENLLAGAGEFEVTELDDKDLEGVAGGFEAEDTNGNCYGCGGGTPPPGPYSNGNCHNCTCTGSGTES